MPASVKIIQKDAFLRCSKIQSAGPIGSGCQYEFPWTEEIPANAFSGLRGLKTAILPATIRKVGNNAFKDCKELDDLSMPKTAKVSKSCFKGCDALREIKAPDMSNPLTAKLAPSKPYSEKQADRPVFLIINERLEQYNGNDRSVIVPDDVRIIGSRAFRGNGTLENVTLPAKVDTVEQNAFESCFSLTALHILGTVKSVGANAFGSLNWQESLAYSVCSAIPISSFTKAEQSSALRTFSYRFEEYDPKTEVFIDNLKFFGTHLKQPQDYGNNQFYHYLIENDALRHAVLNVNAIPVKELKWLIPAVQEAGHPEITSELLDYQNRLLADKDVKMRLKKAEKRAEGKQLSTELSIADWRKLLKFGYENGDIIIKRVMIHEPVVTIPDHIGAKAVRIIATGAFSYNRQAGQTELWSPDRIVLPEGVTEIRYGAFFYTRGTEIFIPSTVKTLPRGCFLAAQNLTLHLRTSVEELSDVLALESEEPAIKAIHAPARSYAEQYAKDHGILFVAEE